ncbi:MAG TPA: PEP-CTERM sorting domain-containing protein, partial [Ferruginibacter sp.]|nr:PEP-CTERM sorting domain-containing protein [Ferruginibacter sp.]
MKNNNNRLIYTGAFLAATLTFGQVVQAAPLILGGNQTISTDTTVESIVVGNSGTGPTGGDGNLTVNNGATLTNSETNPYYFGLIGGREHYSGTGYSSLGFNIGSTGVATVTGANSLWQNSGTLSVGGLGQGTLNIENGGGVISNYSYIGSGSGSTGTATVTGANSFWQTSIDLVINNGGLNIENGGKVISDWGLVGNSSTGAGTGVVTVTGENSLWQNSGVLFIGAHGHGILNIENGGKVINTNTYDYGSLIGSTPEGTGVATVTGANSHWQNSGFLYVGERGNGTLNIEDGGKVTSTTDSIISALSGSTGTVTVTGANSRWESSGNLYVGGTQNGSGGNGSLIINDGGAVSATNGVTIWSTGSLSGNGGTIEGDVINHGLISPGNSPGVLMITGDLTLESDSVLLMEIFGPTAYDQLIIGGNFVAGGILELDFGGYMPEFDVPYDLFQVAGGMSGDFSEIKFLNPAAGFDAGLLSLSFAGGENGGMFQLIMANNGDPGNNTVPEPASILLIGLGGLAMLMLRRRSP